MGQWEEGNKRSKVKREKLRANTPEGNLRCLQHHTVAAAECRGMGSKTEKARFHHPLMPGKGEEISFTDRYSHQWVLNAHWLLDRIYTGHLSGLWITDKPYIAAPNESVHYSHHPTPRSHSKTPLNRLPSPLQPPTESCAPAASAAPEPSRSLTCCFGVSKSLLLLSSPPGASEPPLSLFFLFFRTAQAPGAKNNRGSGERRVPAARISGPKRGWRRRGRPMQRIARRQRQPGCCGRQLKNGSRKLLLTMNEGIRFTRQGPPAKLGFPAGFSNHICISPPLNPPRTVPTAHWASIALLQSQSWSRAATCWFPLAAVHHGYRGDRDPICIGLVDWLAEEQFFRGWGKDFPSLPRKTTPGLGSALVPARPPGRRY
nr:uncharacterized protein LOC129038986 [Pongo pygmaeus]